MMKSRRQQTQTLERQQEQTTSILESESKTGEIVIYLSLFIWVLLTETRLGTLFIFTSFIFFKLFEKLVFDCVYVIKIEQCLTATVMHFMDEPKGNPNVMLTGGTVYQLLICHLIWCFAKCYSLSGLRMKTVGNGVWCSNVRFFFSFSKHNEISNKDMHFSIWGLEKSRVCHFVMSGRVKVSGSSAKVWDRGD